MDTYDMINLYYYFLYQPLDSFLQRVFANLDIFLVFQAWVKDSGFDIPCIQSIMIDSFHGFQMKDKVDFLEENKKDFSEIVKYREKQKEKYQVFFMAGLDPTNEINKAFTSSHYVEQYSSNVDVLFCNELYKEEELLFYGAHTAFIQALLCIDQWPAILITKENECYFVPVSNLQDVRILLENLNPVALSNRSVEIRPESYFIQLSDLHLGAKTRVKGKQVLAESIVKLYDLLPRTSPLHFLITGDLMNSPNRKNMYEASSFMNGLKKDYKADVTFVLGNHDMIVNGFNIFNRQKSKVVAYLLGENIKVLEKEKIILIKINSMVEGNLARGKVGSIQLQEIEEELETIENIEEYTIMALLHHHVLEISKDDFLKTKWHEKMFVGKWIENTKVLVDAPEVIDWFDKHRVQYVFHGHKHLPFFRKYQNMSIISGGSSCGGVKENNSRYLSYNVLKYDYCQKQMKYCFIFYDDITKQERQRIKVHVMEGRK